MLTEDQIRQKIQDNIPNVYNCIVTDLSFGCGQSFDVVVVTNEFASKNKLMRNRMINGLLKDELKIIHAFSLKCYTEEEWSKIVV